MRLSLPNRLVNKQAECVNDKSEIVEYVPHKCGVGRGVSSEKAALLAVSIHAYSHHFLQQNRIIVRF